MKIYVVGPVASGKTTLARRLSDTLGVSCFHLDEVVYEKVPGSKFGNRRRTDAERDSLFAEILARESYIIEDTGRECFVEGMRQADAVILLDTPRCVRINRIVVRWIKQNLGLEPCAYRPNAKMLRMMFRWASNYDNGSDGTKARAMQFGEKLSILRSRAQIERYISKR